MTPPTWLYWPAAGAAPGSPWAPTDLANLRCWLDASDSGTITLSGSSISLWADKEGSNDADDAVDGSNNKVTTARPTIVTAAQNGLDAVGFNGSQWFDHNTARGLLRNRSCALFGVAMKYGSIDTGTFQCPWLNRNSGTTGQRFSLVDSNDGAFRAAARRLDDDTTNAQVFESSDPPFNTDWHVHVVFCDYTNNAFEYWIDGTKSGSTQTFQSGAGNTTDNDLDSNANTQTAIGALTRAGSNFYLSSGSRIGEMICAAKSSGSYATADRQSLEGYLAWKWGLEGNLPGGHPYENAAPLAP